MTMLVAAQCCDAVSQQQMSRGNTASMLAAVLEPSCKSKAHSAQLDNGLLARAAVAMSVEGTKHV